MQERDPADAGRSRRRPKKAWSRLVRTADLVRRVLDAVVEPHGITLQQYNVLRILRGAGAEGLPTLEIGERMIEQAPGVTRLLDRLEAKGLVRRQRCRGPPSGPVLDRAGRARPARPPRAARCGTAARRCLAPLAPSELASFVALLDMLRSGVA